MRKIKKSHFFSNLIDWDFERIEDLTDDFLRDGFAAGRQIKESEAGEPLTEGKVRNLFF